MKDAQLSEILKTVQALTFANPFGPERAELEEALLTKLGDPPLPAATNPGYNNRFRRLLPWIEAADQELLQRATRKPLPEKFRERTAYFAFFVLYHKLVPDLDALIRKPAGDNSKNRALYSKLQQGVATRRALIEHASQRIWNQPAHLFACYYQIRRAFHAIHHELIGESQPIKRLRARVWESVFTKDMMSYQQWMFETVGRFPTLILGPSGSGKELVARALGLARFLPYDSKSGAFADGPNESFYPINLSALSETLIESELFGHCKGAFTGAFNDRQGLFSLAGGYGSVFLDEIGEVKESTQVKLLRLLQSGEFQAIGDNKPARYTGKIIAATHKNLAAEMEVGRFREDFYYRLCGDQIHTVALREILADEPADLATSVRYICTKLIGAEGAEDLSGRILTELHQHLPPDYPWPGNFRELEQAVRNCIVRGSYQPAETRSTGPSMDTIFQQTEISLEKWTQLYAQQAIQNYGSYRAAAQQLGVDQRTVKKLSGA
jgi:transcriptional regulator with GAF, ATPase, and Fis domain